MALLDVLNLIIGVYTIILVVAGTFLNLLCLVICLRIRRSTTFVFMSFLALFSIVSLYWWNLNHATMSLFGIDFLAVNAPIWSCKLGNYIQFSSIQLMAWFLIFISLDRTMSVYFKAWNIIHFRSKQAIQLSIITIMFFALININILTEFGFETVENETTLMFCYKVEGYPKTYWMETYGQISLVVASLLPSIILIVSNIALVVRVRRRSRLTEPSTSQSIKRCSRLNNLVVVLTVVFMISTLPVSCAGFFFTQLFSTDWGIFLIAVLDCLSFTYSAFNFVITYMTNRRFKRQVKILFKLVVRRS